MAEVKISSNFHCVEIFGSDFLESYQLMYKLKKDGKNERINQKQCHSEPILQRLTHEESQYMFI